MPVKNSTKTEKRKNVRNKYNQKSETWRKIKQNRNKTKKGGNQY